MARWLRTRRRRLLLIPIPTHVVVDLPTLIRIRVRRTPRPARRPLPPEPPRTCKPAFTSPRSSTMETGDASLSLPMDPSSYVVNLFGHSFSGHWIPSIVPPAFALVILFMDSGIRPPRSGWILFYISGMLSVVGCVSKLLLPPTTSQLNLKCSPSIHPTLPYTPLLYFLELSSRG